MHDTRPDPMLFIKANGLPTNDIVRPTKRLNELVLPTACGIGLAEQHALHALDAAGQAGHSHGAPHRSRAFMYSLLQSPV